MKRVVCLETANSAAVVPLFGHRHRKFHCSSGACDWTTTPQPTQLLHWSSRCRWLANNISAFIHSGSEPMRCSDLLVGLLNVLPELILRIESHFFCEYDIFCKLLRSLMVTSDYSHKPQTSIRNEQKFLLGLFTDSLLKRSGGDEHRPLLRDCVPHENRQ